VKDALAIRQGGEGFQPEINAGFAPSGGEWSHGDIRARETNIPAVRFPRHRDGLGCALQRATPPNGNAANLGERQGAVVQGGSVAKLLVGERVVAIRALEAWIARRLPFADTAEERLEGTIQPGEHVLQHLRVDALVFGPHLFDGG